jgi:hypothetical protein
VYCIPQRKFIKNLYLLFLLLFLIQIKYVHKPTSRHYLNYLKNYDYVFWTHALCGGRFNPVSNVMFGNHFLFYIDIVCTG